jgi:hypothetical protein
MNQPHVAYDGAQKDVKHVFWEVKEWDFERTRGFDYRIVADS